LKDKKLNNFMLNSIEIKVVRMIEDVIFISEIKNGN
jgi:hypothetical protein